MTLSELFERKALDTPEVIAVVCGGLRLTYFELNAQANRLARYLIGHGARLETIIAAALPRDESMIVTLLAILKAGAVYLPIDLDNPPERIGLILADAVPAAIVTTDVAMRHLPDAPGLPSHVLSDPELRAELAAYSDADLADLADLAELADGHRTGLPHPENAAYVMYTSGSTGRPKGVAVSHASITNMSRVYSRASQVFGAVFDSPGQRRLRVAHLASWAFDAAWAPVLWMIDGHELHIVSEADRRDPEALIAYLTDNIDCLNCTPEYLRQLMELGFLAGDERKPAFIIVGGDAITPSLWTDLRAVRGATVYNAYGPTESTLDAIDCLLSVSAEPRIGQPVTNVSAYVLDEDLGPVRPGETGEASPRRRRDRSRLPRKARPDRRALRRLPVRSTGRADVPHGRPGPLSSRRQSRVHGPS